MEADKFELEKKLQDINFKYVQLQTQLNKDETTDVNIGKKLVSALASEKEYKARLVKLEAVVAAYESRVSECVCVSVCFVCMQRILE